MKRVTSTELVPQLPYGEVAKLSPQERKDRLNKQKNDWQRRNPEKARAKVYAQRYTPLREKCDWCDSIEGLGRHHPDYSKPLDVLTLCVPCHKEADRIRRREGDIPIDSFVNRHCQTCSKQYPCGRGHPSYEGRPCSLWEEQSKKEV